MTHAWTHVPDAMLRRKAAAISGFFRAAGVSPRFLASVRGIPGVGAGGVCPQMRAVCESSFEYVPATGTAYRVVPCALR